MSVNLTIGRAAVMSVALVCAIGGTAGSQLRYDKAGTTAQLFFFETVVEAANGHRTVIKAEKPNGCTEEWDRNRAAYTFAMLSCVVAAAAVGLTVAEVFVARLPLMREVSIGVSGTVSATLLASWSIELTLFKGKFCDATKSFAEADYTVDDGLVLILLAWALSLVATAAGVLSNYFLISAPSNTTIKGVAAFKQT